MSSLKICTYNVWLMSPIVTFFAHKLGIDVSPSKLTRAKLIGNQLPNDLDILVLCEAFCEKSTNELFEELQARTGMKYRTPILRSKTSFFSSGKLISGGVVIISRWPLDHIEEFPYGSICSGDDSLADKGILYVKFKLQPCNKIVHIFASHTQAWDDPKSAQTRRRQLELLKSRMDQFSIPKEDIVLVVGDLNVPREAEDHYNHMIQTLNCSNFNQDELTNPSFNHITNALASSGPSSSGSSSTLDYILVSKEHVTPSQGIVSTRDLKAPEPYIYKNKKLIDLSDHYPVFGDFTF